jgi:outer membrane protein OmpA-like peptidoglycan-associated protein
MLNEEDRRKRRRIWFSGSLALLVLAAAGAGWAVLHIPADIAARTVSALQTSGLDPRAAVSVEGRTVTLSGEVPNTYTRARMRAIAGSIRGVRTVIDQLSVAPLPPAEDASRPSPPEQPPAGGRSRDPAAATAPPPPARPEKVAGAALDPPRVAAAAPSMPAAPAPTGTLPEALAPTAVEGPPAAREHPPALSEPESKPLEPPPARLRLPLLHFEFAGTRLTPDSELRLAEIVAELRKRPDERVEVAGHADALGSKSYNQELSLRRARAVADRLVAAGIDAARLQTRGYRDIRPLTDNHSRQGRAMNRRVELVVIE